MISQKSKYALRALLILARESGNGPVLISDIARRGGIPKKYLEQILLALKNTGILTSRKGRGGGYALGRSPSEITFADVLRLLDGPLAPVPCVSLTAHRKCDDCEDEETCEIRKVMWVVREQTARVLEGASLATALGTHDRTPRAAAKSRSGARPRRAVISSKRFAKRLAGKRTARH
jgi:Rrf2 family protein